MASKVRVKARCHVVVDGQHIWPDDQDGVNRKAGRRIEAEVDESALVRFGDDLIRIGKAKDAAEPDNKQVTGTKTK